MFQINPVVNHRLDVRLMEGACASELIMREHGIVALIAIARTRVGEKHTYMLKEFQTSSLEPVRAAFSRLFVRNDVRSYFFGLRGSLIEDQDSLRVTVSGGKPEIKREVMFYVSADDDGACQAYSLITRAKDGSLGDLSCLYGMPVDGGGGPFIGLLNPALGVNSSNEAYVLAEQIECSRLISEKL